MLEIARANGTGPYGIFHRIGDSSWIVKPEIKKKLEDFIKLCNQAGVTRLKEWHTTPDEYFEIVNRVFNISMQSHLALGKKVTPLIPASTKYSGGNQNILTDGLRGTADWYYMWLGYEGNDMEIIIDLKEIKNINKISGEFLQDVGTWIFMPEYVRYSVSVDGENFQEIGTIINEVPEKEEGVIIRLFEKETEAVKARYIKVYAKNIGLCPGWHIGSGGKAWIFVDEIIVD